MVLGDPACATRFGLEANATPHPHPPDCMWNLICMTYSKDLSIRVIHITAPLPTLTAAMECICSVIAAPQEVLRLPTPAAELALRESLFSQIGLELLRKMAILRKKKDNKASIEGISQKQSHISKQLLVPSEGTREETAAYVSACLVSV
ncbi:hypothetical protein CapIbe_010084 [Capra ibex]